MKLQKRSVGHPFNVARGLPAGRTVKLTVNLSPAQRAKLQRAADRSKVTPAALIAQWVDTIREEQ